MRGFIVLCFSALAVAAPQGYTYQQGTSGYQTLQPALVGQQQLINNIVDTSSIGSINTQFATQQGGSFGLAHHAVGPAQRQEVIVSKRFFIHSAPEEHDEEYREKVLTVGTPRKNYNVVFIRAPHKSTKKASIKITPAANEEKTVIYVLSKKTDVTDIDAQVQELPVTTSKPEVYFIKYKTPEEAAHAQEKIQAEYDSLGGSTQVSNEGIAPVSSVIGVLGDKGRLQQQQLAEQQAVAIASSQASASAAAAAAASNAHLAQEIVQSAGASASAGSGLVLNTSNTYLPPNYYY